MKRTKNKILAGIVCLAVLAGIAIPVSIHKNNYLNKKISTVYSDSDQVKEDAGFEIHYIDVGQADSTLVICDGEAMLIDGGTNEAGSKVVNYIQESDVKYLKYMIGTHPHEDHIGGLDCVIDNVDTETLFLPSIEYDSVSYKDLLESAKEQNVKMMVPTVGDTYSLGTAVITVLAPVRAGYADTNNYSIVVRIDYGNTSFLFTGDAEIESEYDMMETGLNLKTDVLKVGHHGSDTSTSEGFIKEVSPVYAVVSVGKSNSYGHPSEQTLKRLTDMGVICYRTDEAGTIIAYSNGKNIAFELNGKLDKDYNNER